MDNLIIAIALLGVGVLGMGWLSWSARSTKIKKAPVSDKTKNISHTNYSHLKTQNPNSGKPNIVAFCRTPTTMLVKEDTEHFYVTYKVDKQDKLRMRGYEFTN